MALDYILIGISSVILILYILSFFLLMHTRKKLDGKAKTAFTFFIISLFFIIIRRLQQVFETSKILNPIPYSPDIIALMLGISFFLAAFYFHQAIIKAHTEHRLKTFKEKLKTPARNEIQKEKTKAKLPVKDGYLDLTE